MGPTACHYHGLAELPGGSTGVQGHPLESHSWVASPGGREGIEVRVSIYISAPTSFSYPILNSKVLHGIPAVFNPGINFTLWPNYDYL